MNNPKIIEHKLTYGELWNNRNNAKGSYGICLSEFIDNSLSSFLLQYDEKIFNCIKNNNSNGIQNIIGNNKLKIDIDINTIDENCTLSILDNAGGMDNYELEIAMQRYKNAESKESKSINQYGIGMKFGIFWFGSSCQIYTKKFGQQEYLGNYQAKDKKDSDEVRSIIETSNDEIISAASGTKIIIDIWPNKKEIAKKTAKLMEFLGFRYGKYISNNIMSISIIKNGEYIGDIEETILQPFKLSNALNLKGDFTSSNEAINFINLWIKNNESFINKNNFELFNTLVNKLKNNDSLVCDYDMLLENFSNYGSKENKLFKIHLKILNKPSELKYGVSILHNNRYIMQPPISGDNDEKIKPYIFNNSRPDAERWLNIELNLEDLPDNYDCKLVKPEENKTDIIFEDNENYLLTKDNFKNSINKFFNEIYPFLELIKQLNKYIKKEKNKEITPHEISKLTKELPIELKDTLYKNDEKEFSFSIRKDSSNSTWTYENKIDVQIVNFDEDDEDEAIEINNNWILKLDAKKSKNNLYVYKFNESNKIISLDNSLNNIKVQLILSIFDLVLRGIIKTNNNQTIESIVASLVEKKDE